MDRVYAVTRGGSWDAGDLQVESIDVVKETTKRYYVSKRGTITGYSMFVDKHKAHLSAAAALCAFRLSKVRARATLAQSLERVDEAIAWAEERLSDE